MFICLNMSIYDLIYQFFHSHMKKSSKSFLKKRSWYISSFKTDLAINFLKKNFCTWPKKGAGAERVNAINEKFLNFIFCAYTNILGFVYSVGASNQLRRVFTSWSDGTRAGHVCRWDSGVRRKPFRVGSKFSAFWLVQWNLKFTQALLFSCLGDGRTVWSCSKFTCKPYLSQFFMLAYIFHTSLWSLGHLKPSLQLFSFV